MYAEVGEWLFRSVFGILEEWNNDSQLRKLRLSVNVSPKQLLDPGFEVGLNRGKSEYKFIMENVRLELTESDIFSDYRAACGVMERLRHAGYKWSLDDFGTGYSSLSHLKGLPVSEVKIDQSFVRDVESGARSKKLITNIARIAIDLDLGIVAEGIERESQFEALKSAGCEIFQGYLISPPMPLAEFTEFCRKQKPADESVL